jgi:hypothetical protein
MAATKNDLIRWFESGVEDGNLRMVVWCDTYDFEDYPVYTDLTGDDLKRWTSMENGQNMKRLMEVYDLTADMDAQMSERRAFHY